MNSFYALGHMLKEFDENEDLLHRNNYKTKNISLIAKSSLIDHWTLSAYLEKMLAFCRYFRLNNTKYQ
jgi:hypothetical protein